MEIRVLQYFLAVAREGTVVAAAESLHLTQPTLSRQLRDLEDELGKKLFEKAQLFDFTDPGGRPAAGPGGGSDLHGGQDRTGVSVPG